MSENKKRVKIKFSIIFYFLFLSSFILSSNPYANNIEKNTLEKSSPRCCLGWREWVELPLLFNENIMAKIDSGAKTSSLHATNISYFEKESEEWVRFKVYPRRNDNIKSHFIEAKVVETKNIRSSNGKVSTRPVIETSIRVANQEWQIQINLINRSKMGYRMLLGREAINSKFFINSNRSFISNKSHQKKLNGKSKRSHYLNFISLSEKGFKVNLIKTFILFLILIFVRYYSTKILKSKKNNELHLSKKILYFQNRVYFALLSVGIFIIWLDEFKTLSIYLMAISVAIVITMRDAIKNFHGGMLLISQKPFKVGDNVQVKNITGEITESNVMTTKISTHKTGKLSENTILVPNSIFLTNPTIKMAAQDLYINHTFTYVIKENKEWKKKEEVFLSIINDITKDYENDLLNYITTQGKKSDYNPSVNFTFDSAERLIMLISIPTLTSQKSEIEAKVVRRFIEEYYK